MITIKAGKVTFELFSSIKELPITRYKLLQQYLLQDAGIGSTVSDFDQHMSKTITLLSEQKYPDAVEEMNNMRYNFYSAVTGLSFKCMSFACLVNKIGAKDVTDVSAAGLAATVAALEKVKMNTEDLQQHWEGIKKKLIPNLAPTSPDISEMTLTSLKTSGNGIS